jgi:hypothetical protein
MIAASTAGGRHDDRDLPFRAHRHPDAGTHRLHDDRCGARADDRGVSRPRRHRRPVADDAVPLRDGHDIGAGHADRAGGGHSHLGHVRIRADGHTRLVGQSGDRARRLSHGKERRGRAGAVGRVLCLAAGRSCRRHRADRLRADRPAGDPVVRIGRAVHALALRVVDGRRAGRAQPGEGAGGLRPGPRHRLHRRGARDRRVPDGLRGGLSLRRHPAGDRGSRPLRGARDRGSVAPRPGDRRGRQPGVGLVPRLRRRDPQLVAGAALFRHRRDDRRDSRAGRHRGGLDRLWPRGAIDQEEPPLWTGRCARRDRTRIRQQRERGRRAAAHAAVRHPRFWLDGGVPWRHGASGHPAGAVDGRREPRPDLYHRLVAGAWQTCWERGFASFLPCRSPASR